MLQLVVYSVRCVAISTVCVAICEVCCVSKVCWIVCGALHCVRCVVFCEVCILDFVGCALYCVRLPVAFRNDPTGSWTETIGYSQEACLTWKFFDKFGCCAEKTGNVQNIVPEFAISKIPATPKCHLGQILSLQI